MSGREEFLLRSINQSFDEWLTDVLSKVKGERLDIVAVVYEQIIAEEDSLHAFQYFLQNADDIVSSEEWEIPQHYNAAKVQEMKSRCEAYVSGVLEAVLGRNYSEDDFYRLLWESIVDHPLLSEEDDVIYAIYSIWQDGRIPYFQMEEGFKMTNDQFAEITRKNMDLIKQANFIIRSSIEQRTEVSGLLLKIISKCESEEDQVVVLAQILARLEQKTISQVFSAFKQ